MSDQIELEECIAQQGGDLGPSFTVEVGVLHKAINAVKGAIEKSGIPILGNALFVIENGRLSVSATDMEISVTKTIIVNVRAPGTFTVSAVTLADLLKRLPTSAIFEASIESGVVLAKCGRSKISLKTLPVEDYPQLISHKDPVVCVFPLKDFSRSLANVNFAIATELTRQNLCGVYFHVLDKDLNMVATNGVVLAMNAIPMLYDAAFEGVIVPRKTVAMLRTRLSDADSEAEVRISVTETVIQFDIGDTTIRSKLVDGTYPEYQRVIPREVSVPVRIMPESLKKASAIAGNLSTELDASPVSIEISSNVISVSSPKTSQSTATTELDAGEFEYAGEPIEIALGSRQLDQILSALSGDAIFHIRDSLSTVLVKDTENKTAVYVLQPFRI